MIDPKAIIRVTAHTFGVNEYELCCNSRKRRWTLPRHTAMYLLWMLTPMSMEEVGDRIGSRHRPAVQHAIRRIKLLKEVDARLSAGIDSITTKVTAIAA